MAFKRSLSATFKAPVEVNIANDKGTFDKSTFNAHFKRHTTAELDALRKENLTNAEVVRRVITGWDMTDEETKEPVPFTEVELEVVLQISPTPFAIAQAFWDGASGARAKN